MRDGTKMAMLFPFLAVLIIAVFAGGLGVIFMVLESAVPDSWGVIGLGAALVVGVPATTALIQRRVEKESRGHSETPTRRFLHPWESGLL